LGWEQWPVHVPHIQETHQLPRNVDEDNAILVLIPIQQAPIQDHDLLNQVPDPVEEIVQAATPVEIPDFPNLQNIPQFQVDEVQLEDLTAFDDL
jgi:hypothetical protein